MTDLSADIRTCSDNIPSMVSRCPSAWTADALNGLNVYIYIYLYIALFPQPDRKGYGFPRSGSSAPSLSVLSSRRSGSVRPLPSGPYRIPVYCLVRLLMSLKVLQILPDALSAFQRVRLRLSGISSGQIKRRACGPVRDSQRVPGSVRAAAFPVLSAGMSRYSSLSRKGCSFPPLCPEDLSAFQRVRIRSAGR